ncbi:MAG: tryptophan synthase subunit alpha [Dehalococcoidia bacterium]|nr:tryptophan synthase subunit alpha [Dehalococcoidia bacterium]
MGSRRLQKTFQELAARGRTGIIPFVTVGFPDMPTTLALVPALAKVGADIIELGVPFSDPLADGATIQKASFHALRQGITLRRCLEACASLRGAGLSTPLIFMGYYNPLLALGLKTFAVEAQRAGLDGIIVADLPPEESGPLREECLHRGIDVIPLLAPTSTEQRIAAACAVASGFIYCVSLAGVTGVRAQLSQEAFRLVERVRACTSLPVAVGFGVSRREQVEAIGKYADAVVVGSALINAIDSAPKGEAVARATRFLSELRDAPEPLNRGAG